MAKKTKEVSAKDLLRQYRGDGAPPVSNLTPEEVMQGKKIDVKALAKEWFKKVKQSASPDGFLGVKTEKLSISEHSHSLVKSKKKGKK